MLFLWGVTMVLGDSLQTEQETAPAGVCWTCVPQVEGASCCVTWSPFSGFLCLNTNYSVPPYHSTEGLRGLNNALITTLMYKASQDPSFTVKQTAKQEAFPHHHHHLWTGTSEGHFNYFSPWFMVGVNASLPFRTTSLTFQEFNSQHQSWKLAAITRGRKGWLQKRLFSPTPQW